MTASGPRPGWLRPIALALVVGAHAAAFAVGRSTVVVPASGSIEIAVAIDTTEETRSTPELMPTAAAAPEPPPPEPEVEPPPPEPVVEPPPPEPVVEPPRPEPVVEPPPPEPPVAVAPEPPRPAEVVRPVEPPRRPVVAPRREAKREPNREPRRPPSAGAAASAASRATAEEARRAAARSYAALVSAELLRLRHYPAAARDAGVGGVAVVAFVVGPGGGVTGHTIVRSSGHPVLDAAVHRMMAAVHLPPPPEGTFRSSVPIRFDLAR